MRLTDLSDFVSQFDPRQLDSVRVSREDFDSYRDIVFPYVFSSAAHDEPSLMFRNIPIVLDDSLTAGVFAARTKPCAFSL